MPTRTCSLIATLVAALGLLPGSASAQTSKKTKPHESSKPVKSSTPSKSAKPTKPARPGREAVATATKNYDFLADEIDGSRIRPDNTTIFGREVVLHDSLIRVRTEFIAEILKAAE